ncbi:MAG: hypothetical protein ACT4PW_05220 [Acidimicrobiia bacterium]
MDSDHATLAAVTSSLGELTARVTQVADRHVGTASEDIAVDLYEVERSLRAATRRLSRLVDRMG